MPAPPDRPSRGPAPPPLAELVRRVGRRSLRLRCPQCGEGPVPARFGRVREACPTCGLVYRREPGAMTGPMYLTAAVNQLFAAAVIIAVRLGTDWDLATSLAVGLPLVVAFSLAFLPLAQSLWVGVEYATDWIDREPWVDPR